MKYSANHKPIICMQTNSTCYKNTGTMTVKGALWHSTGANNPWIKRYVQPSDNASDKGKMLDLIGKNAYGNDWNHVSVQAGLNCWIGKLADGTVAAVQTMPWNYRPWGCGSGSKGSCNHGWIQFEICEDALCDKTYFEAVYQEACEITAYLCTLYKLNPTGTVAFNGANVPGILCHADSSKHGLGSSHGDVLHWFKKYGKTMDDVRKDVADLMKSAVSPATPATPSPSAQFAVGDMVRLLSCATYTSGMTPKNWVFEKTLYIRELRDNGKSAVVSTEKTGDVTGVVAVKYLVKSGADVSFSPYLVRVTTDVLNIRKGAGTNYKTNGAIRNKGMYTIVEEATGTGASKWGLLKSYAKNRDGWISLDYAKKV